MPEGPHEVAWQLLDSAHAVLGKAHPSAQAALLWQIANCYTVLDKKKAMEMLEQAMSVAGAGQGAQVSHLETFIVRSMSGLDLTRALEMVRAIPPDSRNSAIRTIIPKLIDKRRFDDAVTLLNMGSGSHYPFDSVALLLAALKDEDDPRRAILFGNALTSFQMNPARDFGQMLAANWEHLPRASVLQALDAIITKTSSYTDDHLDGALRHTIVIAGLDRKAFENDLSDPLTTDEIREDMKEGEMAEVGGTPTFFINGKRYNGPISFSAFQTVINQIPTL